MENDNALEELEEQQDSHPGGRFNRLLGITVVVVAMAGGMALALGIQSSGTSQDAAAQKAVDDSGAAARDRGEIADLAANGTHPHTTPNSASTPAIFSSIQAPFQRSAPKPPSRYAQWRRTST